MLGARFLNVPVPQGATIDSASISLYAQAAESSSIVFAIAAEDVDDSVTFSGTHDPYMAWQVKTTAIVEWTPGAWSADTWYESADIASVIQEIVDRDGWASGNSLVLLVYAKDDTQAGYRPARMYDYAGNVSGPILNITYSESGGTAVSAVAASSFAAGLAVSGVAPTAHAAGVAVSADAPTSFAAGLDVTAEAPTSYAVTPAYVYWTDDLPGAAYGKLCIAEEDVQVVDDFGAVADQGWQLSVCDGALRYTAWFREDGCNLQGEDDVKFDFTDRKHRVKLECQSGRVRLLVDGMLLQTGGAAGPTTRTVLAWGSWIPDDF